MSVQLGSFTIDDFRSLLGETFSLEVAPGIRSSARLSEVSSLGWNTPRERGGRESFSLLYHAPDDLRIPQAIYSFSHPRLGTQEIFVVPLGPDRCGMRLEAIFNF